MEKLTKTQIILLALLASFITSIATGIVTVSLLDQAPPALTQTINRVVERTVEKVVPGQSAGVVTKETTVVVKEENLIIDAIDKNRRNVVLFETDGKVAGVGFLVSQDGVVATDSSIPSQDSTATLALSNGKKYSYEILLSASDFSLVKIVLPDASEESKFNRASFRDASTVKLGQTVVALGGLGERAILSGIISKINTENAEDDSVATTSAKTAQKLVASMETNILLSQDFEGSPMIDVDGLVVGINLSGQNGFYLLPSNAILKNLEAPNKE